MNLNDIEKHIVLLSDIERIKIISLMVDVVMDADDFIRTTEIYDDTSNTAWLWQQGELIKSLERLKDYNPKGI